MKQSECNPYPYSDTNKRYYSYDYYLKQTFGKKCAKIPLDIGLTCPNIDGRCGWGGCIYCSARGSGDFAEDASLSVSEQFRREKEKLSGKWNTDAYIMYFQAHTNTYAPVAFLREKFEEALLLPGVVGINVATRADCLPEEVVDYLGELAKRTCLTVELGLQSSCDETAARINRGHDFAAFCCGYEALSRYKEIHTGVHIIFGLPGETEEDMMRTVRDVAALHPSQVKIHLLHVLRSSRLGKMYLRGEYTPLERQTYISLVVKALELLPPDVVIARLTGDGMGTDLLAPEWSRRKTTVINDIDKLLFSENSWQGKKYDPTPIK